MLDNIKAYARRFMAAAKDTRERALDAQRLNDRIDYLTELSRQADAQIASLTAAHEYQKGLADKARESEREKMRLIERLLNEDGGKRATVTRLKAEVVTARLSLTVAAARLEAIAAFIADNDNDGRLVTTADLNRIEREASEAALSKASLGES